MMRIRIISLFILVFLASNAYAQDNKILFEQACSMYQEANYDSAVSMFESILAQDLVSTELYYNLGNAYYKKGDVAAAILNYERALKLSPSDDDSKHNLKLANAATVDRIEAIPMVFYEEWWNAALQNSTVSSKARTAIILLWLSLVFWLVYLFMTKVALRKTGFYLAILCCLFAIGSISLALLQNKQIESSEAAIVFSTSTYVKSSPEKDGANLFLLHEGARVELIDEISDWKKIRIANGNVGWLEAASVEVI